MLKQAPLKDVATTGLTAHLFECYGGFADKKIKDVSKSRRFFVDDRGNGGLASDGTLYGWFCGVVVDVESDDAVLILLEGNVPNDPQVNQTLSALEAIDS